MTIARGSARRYAYCKQSALGTIAATGASAKTIRRSTSTLGLTRDSYEPAEKRTDQQMADSGLGTHKVSGPVDGEFFLGAYTEFLQSSVRKDFAAVSSVNAGTGTGFTIASNVLTRAGGSFITDGITVGMIGRNSGFAAAGNNGRNYLIEAMDALTITMVPLDGVAFTDVGSADEDAIITIVGKQTYIPLTGHTDDYYTVEEYFTDMDKSTVYTNVKPGSLGLNQAPNGYAAFTFAMTGTGESQDLSGASAPYFTSVAAAGTEKAFRTAKTFVFVNGAPVAVATQVNVLVDCQLEAPSVVGSLFSPEVFYGKNVKVTADLTLYLQDLAYRDLLRTEAEFSIAIVMQEVGTANFFAIFIPRYKITAHSITDADTGLQQSIQGVALLPAPANGVLQSSISFQDSTLV